jgi:heterodisulfide reductase subunit A-like polyferredoxin
MRGEPGNFTVTLDRQPRYIDPAKCTGCGDCAQVCPVTIPDEFNAGLAEWHAVYRLYPQAIPAAFAVKKVERAACSLACPAGTNVQGYVQLIKLGKYEEALKLIMERLPLPGVLGRVCHHPCESICRRQDLDEPVAICNLKRFVADRVDVAAIAPPLVEARSEKVAIIGSGPGGLSCAYHLALRGYRPTIFEALPLAGGMLRVGIPSHRLSKDVLDTEINNVLRLGVTLKTNAALGRDFTLDELFSQGYQAVFLGLGCHVGKTLGIPGEAAAGVIQGVEFLRKHNLGEPVAVGRRVAVIGGGNAAIDVACTARRLGAAVTMVYRRTQEEMPIFAHGIEQALAEGVEVQYLTSPREILTRDGRVTGLLCQRMELGEPDASGRRRPIPIAGSEFELPVDMVVPAIGQSAALAPLQNCGIDTNPDGTIQADRTTYQTSRPGVFAAGDVHTGPGIAIDAVAGGMHAAESIDRYLRGMDLAAGRPLGREVEPRWSEIPKNVELRPREVMPTLAPEVACTCFDEVARGFTEAQAQAEADRCLNCGVCCECLQCVTACQAGAFLHDEQAESLEVGVGALVLAPGFKTFDPGRCDTYHYGTFPNVVTSLEFERILSAAGPFGGHLVRPSDHREPQKIAWLQCVGSRDANYNPYCSSVCCMYAIKQAEIAREHSKGALDTTIFFMDLRTHGKDFERYYQRARTEHGLRFVRARIHSLEQVPDRHDLVLRYFTEDGAPAVETFDMVVLSVALEVSPEAMHLAATLGIDLVPETRFARTSPFAPVNASQPGIYVCGAFQGPKDIPQSVTQASAAAAAAGEFLAPARGQDLQVKDKPAEKDLTGQEPRIGVFICRCGTNIAGIIAVPDLAAYARTLPNVVYAVDNLFTCSADNQTLVLQAIGAHRLNRVVVAACSPRTHAPMFMSTLAQAGLNPYLLEIANIRNQAALVHMHTPDAALDTAKDLIRMAVARAGQLEPLYKQEFPVRQAALVLGGGVAGMEAALSLANMGFPVHLVEKGHRLGGNAWNLVLSPRGLNYRGYLEELIRQVESHDKIQVSFDSRVKETGGFIGNFQSTISTPGGDRILEHGVTILATGGQALAPQEYLYGQHPNIFLSMDLDQALAARDPRVTGAEQAVFIQCVGSREPQRPYCSRLCCTHSVESALALKEFNPAMEVFILYRDLRTYGDKELLYQAAREQGVVFIRFDLEGKPRVEKTPQGGLQVTVTDPILGRPVRLTPDILTLASAVLPNPTEDLGELFKVARNADGFLNEAHAKLRPVEFSADGIYLAGLAHYPKPLDESITQAKAAAARAATVLAWSRVEVEPQVALVDQNICVGCGLCEFTCPYGAMHLIQVPGKGWRSENLPAYCKGCGICAAGCPVRAIDMLHFRDRQILAAIHAGGLG